MHMQTIKMLLHNYYVRLCNVRKCKPFQINNIWKEKSSIKTEPFKQLKLLDKVKTWQVFSSDACNMPRLMIVIKVHRNNSQRNSNYSKISNLVTLKADFRDEFIIAMCPVENFKDLFSIQNYFYSVQVFVTNHFPTH